MNEKVLIITIPPQDPTRPPGILSVLSGCCESLEIDYSLIDLNLYMYKSFPTNIVEQLISDFFLNQFRSQENLEYFHKVCEHLVQQIKKEKPTYLAISVFTHASILAANELLTYLKSCQIDVNYKIVIGGLGIYDTVSDITGKLTFGDYCRQNNLVNYCIYGEGEIAFVELLKGNFDYPGINQANAIQILDLDQIPQPSYQKIEPSNYFYSSEPEILVTGSRGCVRNCTFCNVASYWEKYVYRSGQSIADELFDIWKTTGVRKFDFSDSLINGSIKNFREFNKALIRYQESNPDFKPLYKGQFICRPSTQLKEQDYLEMSQAGAETLVVGIESFSNQVRDHMRKKFDNSAIDWHFEMSAKYGIKNVLLLLCGYVTESADDHAINLEYLKKYQKYALSRVIYAINIQVTGLDFSPVNTHTPLDNMIDELGIYFHSDATEGTLWMSMSNPTLTPKERLRRGVELISTAYELGFRVLHFDQKADLAEKQFEKIQQIAHNKIFKLSQL
jgi:radical SAM superfamily enzyme YgiQ (UPF0313 family)